MVETLVGREYRRMLLVPHRNQLEQEVGVLWIDRQEPDLVYYQDTVGKTWQGCFPVLPS